MQEFEHVPLNGNLFVYLFVYVYLSLVSVCVTLFVYKLLSHKNDS